MTGAITVESTAREMARAVRERRISAAGGTGPWIDFAQRVHGHALAQQGGPANGVSGPGSLIGQGLPLRHNLGGLDVNSAGKDQGPLQEWLGVQPSSDG